MEKGKTTITIDREPLIAVRQSYPMLKVPKLISAFFTWAVNNREEFLLWVKERVKEAKDLLCYLSPPQEGDGE